MQSVQNNSLLDQKSDNKSFMNIWQAVLRLSPLKNFIAANKTKYAAFSIKHFVLFVILVLPGSLIAQFNGEYSEENWAFTSRDLSGNQSDGFIDITNMPTGFTLSGSNDDKSGTVSLYTITVPENVTIKFRWSYSTDDDDPHYDMAVFKLNGSVTNLTDPEGSSDQNGEQEVTVTAGDKFAFGVNASDACCGRGHLTIEAFSIADNTLPTMDALYDVESVVNPGQVDIDLTGIAAGILEPSQTITITATSSNPAVIPDPTITYTSPDATGTLSFTPVTDMYGDATITVNVMDDGGTANGSVDNIDATFDVSITSNFPPEIDIINDVESQVNEPISIPLSGINAGGETQTISIAATSSDQSIIADGDISVTYTSPNTTGTLDITPVANASGEAIITVTVSDDGGTADNGKNQTITYFTVNVAPNGYPTINAVADLNLLINDGEQIINLDGIGDGDSDVTQTLVLTATSDNVALIPDPVVTYSSPDATGTLTFTPVTDEFGSATITVSLSDNGGTSNGGSDTNITSFVVNVMENYPPEIDQLGNIVMGINEPDRTVNLSGISAGVTSNAEDITVTAGSGNTSVIDPSGIAVNYTSPGTTGNLVLNSVADAIGESTITVTVTDNGVGAYETQETFVVRVVANRAPEIDQVTNVALDVNATEQTIDLTGILSGEASDYQTLSITAASDNTALIPDPTVTYTSPGTTGSIAFTPVTDATGVANITVTVTDDGGTLGGGINSTTMTFEVSVTGNQPPTLDAIDNVSQTAVSGFTVDLSGISDGTGTSQNLTVTATSNNPTIIPNPTVNYVNGDATGSLDFVPTDFGDATITVTVMDDGGTNNGGIDVFTRTFAIHIGENTPPTIYDWDNGDPLDGQAFILNNGQGDQALLFDVEDDDNNIESVTITGNNNPDLADIVTVDYIPGSFIGGLIFSPVSGQTGTVDFEISVKDDGGTANNGIDTSVSTVTIVVTEPHPYSGSLSADAYEHHVQPFTVDESGFAYIKNLSGDIDAYFSLYENSYDPLNSSNNLISDDTGLTPTLEKDVQYILVTTNDSGGPGSFTNSIGLISGNVSFGYLPNLNFIDNVSMDEDGSMNIPLSGISDGNGNSDNLVLSASDPEGFGLDVIDNLNGSGSLNIAPPLDYYGVSTITVTVTGENGNTFERSFEVTVNPINDAPYVSSAIGDQSYENSFGSAQFDLSTVFDDIEDDALTYAVMTDASGIVDASETGGILTLTEQEPGTVNVTVTANDGNGGEVFDTFQVFVNKINQTITFDALTAVTFGDASFDLAATASSGLTVTFTSSDDNVATVSGTTVTIVGAGTTTITASQAGDADYNAATDVMQDLVVNKATATVTLSDLVRYFDGVAQAVTATTNPSGLSLDMTYDGSSLIPSAIGSYNVVATVNDINYQGSTSGTLIIESVTGVDDPLTGIVRIHPNPAQDILRILVESEVSNIMIYNNSGILMSKIENYKNEEPIKIDQLKSGLYMVRIQTQDQTTIQKFIKK